MRPAAGGRRNSGPAGLRARRAWRTRRWRHPWQRRAPTPRTSGDRGAGLRSFRRRNARISRPVPGCRPGAWQRRTAARYRWPAYGRRSAAPGNRGLRNPPRAARPSRRTRAGAACRSGRRRCRVSGRRFRSAGRASPHRPYSCSNPAGSAPNRASNWRCRCPASRCRAGSCG